jgi:hypothetical protein
MKSRRRFLIASSFLAGSLFASEKPRKARIAITLDLEMSRNFPRWEDTHWDYEKGNLNDETKEYTLEACRRIKAAGGAAHCFVVGRVLEQPDVDWLKRLALSGHALGNHTYDHVNVLATKPEDLQFRFRRSPWLIEGKQPRDVIAENIRITNAALKTRVGVDANGFRTPGGFANGLKDRLDVQKLLLELGFRWVSCQYPAHPMTKPEQEPDAASIAKIVEVSVSAQPFVYPSGLVEIPMSPVSDINAFRTGRWKLEWFLKVIQAVVEATIANGGVFDFLCHPSCMYVVDPRFHTIDLICDLVKKAGDKAEIVTLDAIARPVLKP